MAFTLIELLVVVAIIAVLISFLLPALAAARNMAKRAACSSNQRQMFVSMMDYANEFNGWGPFRVYYATAKPGRPQRVVPELLPGHDPQEPA